MQAAERVQHTGALDATIDSRSRSSGRAATPRGPGGGWRRGAREARGGGAGCLPAVCLGE